MDMVIIILAIVVGILLGYSIYHRVKLNKKVIKAIDNRLWSIPVNVQCQYCKSITEIDFSLDTTTFVCKDCDHGKNKLHLMLTTTIIDDDHE